MRREGEQSDEWADALTQEKSKYMWAYMWTPTVLRGQLLFFSKVVQISYLLNGWGKEVWR